MASAVRHPRAETRWDLGYLYVDRDGSFWIGGAGIICSCLCDYSQPKPTYGENKGGFFKEIPLADSKPVAASR